MNGRLWPTQCRTWTEPSSFTSSSTRSRTRPLGIRGENAGVFAAGRPNKIQPDYSSGILAGGSTFEYQKASPAIVANVNRLREIARRHGVSLKAAALQFSLTHPAAGRGHSCGQPAGTRFAEDHAALAESIHADFWHELQNEKLIDPHGSTAEKRPIMKERPPDE